MIYEIKPGNFEKEIDVAGCFIEYDKKILLLHRLEHKTNGDTVGLPAGKMLANETLNQTIIREVKEETGIDISTLPIKFIKSVHIRHEGHDLVFHMFKLALNNLPEVIINPEEHKNFYWLTKEEILERNDLIHDLKQCLTSYYI